MQPASPAVRRGAAGEPSRDTRNPRRPAGVTFVVIRRRFVWLAAAALAIGAGVVLYRGPGRPFVRGNLGDVAATMLVYALLGLAWRTRPRNRAAAGFAIACAVELGQTVWHATSWFGELTAGSTFDPWDFVAYAAGIGVAVLWDRATAARPR